MNGNPRLPVALTSTAVLVIGLVIAYGILALPTRMQWSEYQSPHVDKEPLPLSAKLGYAQTLPASGKAIDGVLLELVGPLPAEGSITVSVEQGEWKSISTQPLSAVNASNFLLWELEPVQLRGDSPVTLTVTSDAAERIGLAYQIDSTKYAEGSLTRWYRESDEHKEIQGDLAFAVRQQVPPLFHLFSGQTYFIISLVVVSLWFVLAYVGLSRPNRVVMPAIGWQWRLDMVMVGLVVLIGIVAYWPFISRIGQYYTNTDYQKDVLYTFSAQQAWEQQRTPGWHHLTCGGQPLAGNVEANTFSYVPLLSVAAGPVRALNVTMVIEILVGAVGAYVLGRWFRLPPLAAVLPAVVFLLHGFVPNRLWLGHSMYIGGFAWAPWLIVSFLHGLKKPIYLVAGAGLGALILARGDTHVLFYAYLALAVIAGVWLLLRKEARPLVSLAAMSLMMLLLATPKILPVLQGQEHFNGRKLPKHVALLGDKQVFDDLLLSKSLTPGRLKVEHGELEQWENIGSYVGYLPILLGLVGWIFLPRRWRWPLIVLTGLFLVLAEGTAYNLWGRSLPLASSLMRLPSRSMWVVVLFLGISGGFALRYVMRRYGRAGVVVTVVAIGLVIADLGSYTFPKLQQLKWVEPAKTEVGVGRGEFANADEPDKQFLSIAEAGGVVRGSCPDFNASPPFDLTKPRPLVAALLADGQEAPVETTLTVNSIRFDAEATQREFLVQSRPSPLLLLENAVPLPDDSNGLHIMRISSDQPVAVHYRPVGLGAGVVVLLATLGAIAVLGVFPRGFEPLAFGSGGQRSIH